MNQHPRRPHTTFSPSEVVILLIVGVLILGLSGFIFYNALNLLNPPRIAAANNSTPLPIAAQITSTLIPSPTQTPTSPQPSPTLHRTHTPTPTNTVLPLPAACAPQNTEIRLGTVSDVLNGDTLLVDSGGMQIEVGYAGISAPDPAAGQVGEFALQHNRALLTGQAVVLVKDISESDSAGRLLRYVFFNNGLRFANYELVRQGFATVIDSPDQACGAVLRAAEQDARAEALGLWAPTAVPTATFMPTVVLDSGRQAPCSCSVRWECSDFSSRAAAQACFNACNDYNSKLDEDHNGLACEALP